MSVGVCLEGFGESCGADETKAGKETERRETVQRNHFDEFGLVRVPEEELDPEFNMVSNSFELTTVDFSGESRPVASDRTGHCLKLNVFDLNPGQALEGHPFREELLESPYQEKIESREAYVSGYGKTGRSFMHQQILYQRNDQRRNMMSASKAGTKPRKYCIWGNGHSISSLRNGTC